MRLNLKRIPIFLAGSGDQSETRVDECSMIGNKMLWVIIWKPIYPSVIRIKSIFEMKDKARNMLVQIGILKKKTHPVIEEKNTRPIQR